MTDEQKADSRKRRKRRLLWVGGISLTAIGAGLGYGWFFLHNQLTPLVEEKLSDYLNRHQKYRLSRRKSDHPIQRKST